MQPHAGEELCRGEGEGAGADDDYLLLVDGHRHRLQGEREDPVPRCGHQELVKHRARDEGGPVLVGEERGER